VALRLLCLVIMNKATRILNMPARLTMLLSTVLVSLHIPAGASAQPVAPVPLEMGIQCQDWTQTHLSFDEALDEFFRRFAQPEVDSSCLTRASYLASEELFKHGQESLYEPRLRALAELQKSASPEKAQAIEELQIVFQHRWFNEAYESLASYNSKALQKGTAVSAAALAVVIGASFFLHKPLLKDFGKESQTIYFRTFKYLGMYSASFSKSGVAKTKASPGVADSAATVALRHLKPPMDFFDLQKTYVSYSDLNFLKDISGIMANISTSIATHYGVNAALLWSSRAARILSNAPKMGGPIGFIVASVIGHEVEVVTKEKITDHYHQLSMNDLNAALKEINKPDLNDWQLYGLAAKVLSISYQWVSTQDFNLRDEIDDSLSSFRSQAICSRLLQRAPGEPELPNWERRTLMSDRVFTDLFERTEKRFRTNVEISVNKRRERLSTIRAAILQSHDQLIALHKPFLTSFITEQKSLLNRLDEYLVHSAVLDAQVEIVRSALNELGPASKNWNDVEFLKSTAADFGCVHP
jgi:hypothetical protein